MTNLATVFDRVPKLVLFGAAGLIQIALIGLMVADRVMILRTGVDVALQTPPARSARLPARRLRGAGL
jgi:hypothetical protein